MFKTALSILLLPVMILSAQPQNLQYSNTVNTYGWWDDSDSKPAQPNPTPPNTPKPTPPNTPKPTPPNTPNPTPPNTPTPPQPGVPTQQKGFDFSNILTLEERLNKKIIGQEEAIRATVDSILPYTAGIHDKNKPIATLIFIGSTGVGKTELAKELVNELSKNPTKSFIRVNMSEYSLEDGVNKIIGAGLGYRDNEKGGILANAIKANPASVVLLDEFEKANSLVHKLFLQIFDEGYFSDGSGNIINCRSCIFIATTNIGAEKLQQAYEADVPYEDALSYVELDLMKKLSPELYNRMEPVLFKAISEEALMHIACNKLKKLSEKIYSLKKVKVDFDSSVQEYIQNYGYNRKLGARPLNRIVDKEISSTITRSLITHVYSEGDTMIIAHDGSHFIASHLETNK
ncbi:MAG: AAA family ATPase [Parachlamydiales bacterium]|jgi:ATP-dependent Clp protease ATP-binding subunit ClpB